MTYGDSFAAGGSNVTDVNEDADEGDVAVNAHYMDLDTADDKDDDENDSSQLGGRPCGSNHGRL